MSKCQIRFQYCQQDVIIQCNRNELMRDIISRYGTKSRLPISEFYFLYDGNKINPDVTLAQVNNIEKEILILVNKKENERNGSIMKKSEFIKCAQCTNPVFIEFLNDYWIALSDEKHVTKKNKITRL